MDSLDNDSLKQLDELLAASHQAWLFGAGISLDAGIPLMESLTSRVFAKADEDSDEMAKKILEAVKAHLPDKSHIEHILSHLGDYATIAERSKEKKAMIGVTILEIDALVELHAKILKWISETIRWGYRPQCGGDPEQIGSHEDPIVKVNWHRDFVDALFNRSQAGVVERRRAVRLFTTNYDTLLEDALSLCCFSYWDGFSGGAVAYRSHRYGENEPDSVYRAHVIKLHGSIDWHLGDDDRVWRVRDGDLYPDKSSRVLIYPQATKYLATQRDPFAAQFDLFRRTLGSVAENVLAICGYSFGDDHINQEIELALRQPENKTTILAFSQDLVPVLKRWRTLPWAKRLYVITGDGLYVGDQGPFFQPSLGAKRDWWTFGGVTSILKSGAEACVI
ncbi:MAG: SIR2 family protein [Bacilli bacterium]